MIYRKRTNKSAWGIDFTPGFNFIRLDLGKRVWYFPIAGFKFHNMIKIKDIFNNSLVTHSRKRERVTVYREFA